MNSKRVNETEPVMPAVVYESECLSRKLHALTGREVLKEILDSHDPGALIRELPCEDFFWLIKKVGADDSMAILSSATTDQWQYLLDLELWKKDRLDISHTFHWLNLFRQADRQKLARWLLGEGEYLACYYLFKTAEVMEINNEDDLLDLPEGFFSIDGVFHIRAVDREYRESIEDIISALAREDSQRYASLICGLGGTIPAELEEEMYQLKSARLAEHGFLPYEEALAVYAPLDAAVLVTDGPGVSGSAHDEAIIGPVPAIPLAQAGTRNLFTEAVSCIGDPPLLDRLKLEFAGLANQILSADGCMTPEHEDLMQASKRAACIINLGIEAACGHDHASAVKLLERHHLVTLFRVGYGVVDALRCEAEARIKASWFHRQGFKSDFWGEYWEHILSGLVAQRPQYYVGSSEKEEYRDFQWLSDINKCRTALQEMMALDGLLAKLAASYPQKEWVAHFPEATCRRFIFTFWARRVLQMEPAFAGISLEQTREFFSAIRGEDEKPPYGMNGFKEIFMGDFAAHSGDYDPDAAFALKNALSLLWGEFREEYQQVSAGDIDRNHMNFLMIKDRQ